MNHDLVSEIRQKTDIVDIIGERIILEKRGKNFFGVCPFHDDTNPSMSVSREKQIYTCFSCHATGNVFTFLMNYEHIDFQEALKYLGDRVGIQTGSVKVPKKNSKYDSFYEAYQLSNKYFQNNLVSKIGEEARNYLKKRNLSEEIQKEFEIGLSLDKKNDLTELLLKKGYDLGVLNKIGLSVDNYDVYRDRIMFPLYDVSGKCVGFSGRIYLDSGQNKYVNTKETDIFKKGEILYHYHIAKEECRIQKSVIVMEGFMDVIRASTIGVRNTIALMGTALTSSQIQLLKRLSHHVVLCLDGDLPGQNATLSIGNTLVSEGFDVNVLVLPDPDDPDTFILNQGKEKFFNLLDSALNFSDYKIMKMKEKVNFQSDEELSNYIHSVLSEIAKVDDSIREEVMLKRLAKEYDLGYNTLRVRLKELKQNEKSSKSNITIQQYKVTKKDKYQKAIEQILYFMLNHEWVITKVENERLNFPKEEMRVLCAEIIYYYKKYGMISIADFYTYLQDKEKLIFFFNDILASNYSDQVEEEELEEYFKVIKDYSLNEEIKRLTNKMKKEIDPIEQAKIGDQIRKLRIGE